MKVPESRPGAGSSRAVRTSAAGPPRDERGIHAQARQWPVAARGSHLDRRRRRGGTASCDDRAARHRAGHRSGRHRSAAERRSAGAGAAPTAASRATTSPAPPSRCRASRSRRRTRAGPAGGARRVRRRERHDDHLHRVPQLRGRHRPKIAGGSPPDIGMFPQPGRIAGYAASGDVLPLPDDIVATVAENWAGSWLGELTNVDGIAVRRAVQGRPQVARVVQAVGFAENGYEVPTTWDDFIALDRADDRQRQHPAVRRHRVRRRDRLAVHGLDRGAGAARPGHRLLQPVGRPRGAVQLARDRRRDARGDGAVGHRRNVYAAGGSIVGTAFGGQRPGARRRQLHDAPPGELLRRLLARRGPSSATEEGQVGTFYFPANEGQPTLSAATTPRRSPTGPRCGP